MLQKVLLGVCLLPTLAFAESVCLEGPSGGRCHTADMNGEVFKATQTNTDSRPALERNVATKLKTPSATNTNATKQTASTNNRRSFRINTAEQRIRQRAQIIEARAQARRNIATSNNY